MVLSRADSGYNTVVSLASDTQIGYWDLGEPHAGRMRKTGHAEPEKTAAAVCGLIGVCASLLEEFGNF